jgi:hypothetical protein
MAISVQELVTLLVIYTAMTGSGMYWLWHRALNQRARAAWATALFVMPMPTLILLGVVRPGWPQRVPRMARRPLSAATR